MLTHNELLSKARDDLISYKCPTREWLFLRTHMLSEVQDSGVATPHLPWDLCALPVVTLGPVWRGGRCAGRYRALAQGRDRLLSPHKCCGRVHRSPSSQKPLPAWRLSDLLRPHGGPLTSAGLAQAPSPSFFAQLHGRRTAAHGGMWLKGLPAAGWAWSSGGQGRVTSCAEE